MTITLRTAVRAAVTLLLAACDEQAGAPTPGVRARLQPDLSMSTEFTRPLNRSWTRVMAGR